MKRTFSVVLFVIGMYFVLGTVANGQSRQMYFSTGAECAVAIADGRAAYYRPTYFGLHKKLAASEEARPLEADTCVRMLTVKGYQWVAQREGEMMVFRGLQMIRREDCGNPITDVAPPKTAVAEVPPPQCPPGTYASETPGICIQEKETVKINTVTVPGPTVTVDKEVPVYPTCDKGYLYDTQTRQCVKKKSSNKYMWLAIGAGGMFTACEIGKFCGTRTRTITNILTSAPKVQPNIEPRPTFDPRGNPTGGGTVSTRPIIQPNYFGSGTQTSVGGRTTTTEQKASGPTVHVRRT